MSKWWKTKQSDEDNAGDLAEHYRATIRSACKLVEAGARVAVTVDSSFNINCGIPGPHGELQETGLTLFINYGVDGHVPTMELSSQLLSQWLKDLLREIKMSRKGPHLAQHGYACAECKQEYQP